MKKFGKDSLDSLFIKVSHMRRQRVIALLDELGLHFGQPPILFSLWDRDGQTQKELAQHEKLTPATITVTLKRMEKAGWIERRTDASDQRVTRVYLTDKGRDIRAFVENKLVQFEYECFKGFTNEEKILLRRFLLHIQQNLCEVCK